MLTFLSRKMAGWQADELDKWKNMSSYLDPNVAHMDNNE